MLAPMFEKWAGQYGDEFSFAKVNVDELPELADKYGIRAIPTLLLFQEGKVVERLVGVLPEQEFTRILEQHFSMQAEK
jgi:thioredoxin 1